jgi:RNA polymerase sigma-70 factor (ECF subfamily)
MPTPAPTPPSDAIRADERSLIDAARGGNEGAFAALYRLHYPAVVGCLYRRTGDVHAAEDLAADAFLSAWRAMPRYRVTEIPLRIWLLRIATNAANRWARQRRTLRLDRVAPPPTAAPAEADRAVAIEEAQAALLALRPEHQAVISLHYLESLSLEDVAAVLGCRLGTVKSRLWRAREALRSELERRSSGHG